MQKNFRAFAEIDSAIWPYVKDETPRDHEGFGRRWFRHVNILLVGIFRQLDLDGQARCAYGSCNNTAYPSCYCGFHYKESGGLLGVCARWVDLRENWA